MAMAESRAISAETEVSEIEGSESESELSELTDDPPTSSNTSNDSISTTRSSNSVTVTSLLARLKQAPPAIVNRKRKIAQNLPFERKRLKHPSHFSDPKRVTPEQRVKEFSGEKLIVSHGKLFCTACKEEMGLKKSIIELHIKSEKHNRGKIKLANKDKREEDIGKALNAYDTVVHPVGETLPTAQRVYRVKVVSSFLMAGVSLNKLDIFRDILEEGGGYRSAGRCPMSDLIPFILKEEKCKLKEEINGKDVAVIFDGTSRLGEALVIVLRFVDVESWSIQQRLVRMQLLGKSLCGDEIARELISILSTELGISGNKLLACMRDRSSSNNVALRTVKILYPQLLDIGCYSHTIDHVGEKFVTRCLDDFAKAWVGVFSHSPKARLLWREKTGQSMATYSETHWWSRWELLKQVMQYFGDIEPFLLENDVSPSYRRKWLAILHDPEKKPFLEVELAVVIDVGEQFVTGIYQLEGDGPLVFSCFEVLCTIDASIRSAHMPNTMAIIKRITGMSVSSNSQVFQEWLTYAKSCVEPGLKYFQEKFNGELSGSLAEFKARFFCLIR